MNNILVLDDDLHRHWVFEDQLSDLYPGVRQVHTYNYKECIEALINNVKFDLIYLDHDLCDFIRPEDGIPYELTGTEVAKWIAENLPPEKKPDRITVHSWNPAGAQRMVDILYQAGFNVFQKPFGDIE